MKPKSAPAQEPDVLFKTPLEYFIDKKQPLVILADKIDWLHLESLIADRFSIEGRPATPSRFVLGMLILKSVENLSDEQLWSRWIQNPYYQYFTGELYFQHRIPHERSGLSHWRKRLGADILDALLQESLRIAHNEGALKSKDMEVVNVDTTVQEKAITFPTDAKLLYTALKHLVKLAKDKDIQLRQSYLRVCKTQAIMAGRYAHAKQFKRRNKALKFMHTRLGRVIRDIERKMSNDIDLKEKFSVDLRKAKIIHHQVKNRKTNHKIFSWHAPEVECIGKGKSHKPYEFGCKATFTTTNSKTKGGMLVLHAEALHGKPFDGHTLGVVLKETTEITGITPTRAHVDKGYKGHKQNQANYDPVSDSYVRAPWKVFMSGRKGLKPHLKKELRRRSAIEPIIGHMKNEHRLGRNHLKGRNGDRFNAKMAAIGFNFTRLLAWFKEIYIFVLYFVINIWRKAVILMWPSPKMQGC